MRIVYTQGGRAVVFERAVPAVLVGRPKPGLTVDLDLTPDSRVSRPHARIWIEAGQYWIEDLDSRYGTLVSGVEIKGRGKRRLQPGDPVRIGDTTLRVEGAPAPARPDPDATVAAVELPLQETPGARGEVDITARLDADQPAFPAGAGAETETARRLAWLYELPLQFGEETDLDGLLQTIVERLVAIMPSATRGALLERDRSGRLLLKAQVPDGDPFVSRTLARRALDARQAFIWRRGGDVTVTSAELASGMYVPLVWKGEPLGVIAVDNCESCAAFSPDDLRLMTAVAHQAAMAIAQHRTQEELRRHTVLLERLLTNFSSRVRERLLEEARGGRLRLGGQRSEVTVLVSDIRGFTRLTAAMAPEDVGDLLNHYFSALVDVIFRYDGTVGKFVGDSILAVFGSPQPDEQHQEKAVRAAVEMQQAAGAVSAARRSLGQVTCAMGIGVHCGEVLHGFIGSNDRMEFTVIGDAVNRAARYCDGAGPGDVLVSPEVHQQVWTVVHSERTTVRTKHEGDLPAYRITGIRGGAA